MGRVCRLYFASKIKNRIMGNIKKKIKLAQQILNMRGHVLVVDGIAGGKTMAAVEGEVRSEARPNWSKDRLIIALIQIECKVQGFDPGPIDGYWGPQTDHAVSELKTLMDTGEKPAAWRDDIAISDTNPNGWPLQTTSDLMQFYGDTGENQVRIQLPYVMRLSWNKQKRVTSMMCHELVADSLTRVLQRVLDHYGIDRIRELGLDIFGGCGS